MYAVCHNIIIASVFRRTGQLFKVKSVSAYIPSVSKGWPSTAYILISVMGLSEDAGVHGNTDGTVRRHY